MKTLGALPSHIMGQLQEAYRLRGESTHRFAGWLGLSMGVVGRALAGLPLQTATRTHIELKLKELAQGSAQGAAA